MLDMDEVYNTIRELEQGETNFTNCSKLASLYIIRQYFTPEEVVDSTGYEKTSVEQELSDILPSYQSYVEIKRLYQQGRTNKEPVIKALSLVCGEIGEFLRTLYSSTDMPEERNILVGTLGSFDFKAL